MTAARKVKRGIGALLGMGVLAAFCAAAALIWLPAPSAIDVKTQSGPTDALQAQIQASQAQLEELIIITAERPLFHASRQPPLAPEPEVAPAAPELTLALVGILGDEDARLALVRLSSSSELFRLEPGGRLAKWQVLSIGDDFVQIAPDDGAPFVLSIDE